MTLPVKVRERVAVLAYDRSKMQRQSFGTAHSHGHVCNCLPLSDRSHPTCQPRRLKFGNGPALLICCTLKNLKEILLTF